MTPPRRLAPTEQMIADLIAAGGVLRVPYWREQGQPDYRQRVEAAQHWGKVPEGKRLVSEHTRGGELEIRLEDAPEGTVIPPAPVPVPARVSKPHPVARQYRDDNANHQVSKASLPRVVRILHALVAECEKRGYEMKKLHPEPPQRHGYARMSMKGGPDFEITVRSHRYPLHVFEEKVPLRGAWEEQERFRKSDYYSTTARGSAAHRPLRQGSHRTADGQPGGVQPGGAPVLLG